MSGIQSKITRYRMQEYIASQEKNQPVTQSRNVRNYAFSRQES